MHLPAALAPVLRYLWGATVASAAQLALLLGPALVLAALMHALSGLIQRHASRYLGGAYYAVFGWLGTAVHELGHALFCLLFNHFTRQTKSAILKVLLAATLWTALEFYRSELFFLRFPWITPGSALGPTFLSPILGVYGATFLVIAACTSFMQRTTVPLALFLSLCLVCLGGFRPRRVDADREKGIAVTVVQSEECVLQSYVALTRRAQKEHPDLVVWPEYSVPYDVRKSPGDLAILTNLCNEMDAVLVVGTKTVVGPGAKDWHNTALVLDRRGVLGEYYKARPVHFFDDGLPGRRFTPIQTSLGAIATPICFDCDYSEVARKMVGLGAEFFAVPSFDAEEWSADQHRQHALLFRLRAAENARWLACAASSGVSQFVDPHGNVHRSLPPMTTGVLTDRLGRRQGRTVFVRVGWLFPWLALGSTVILLAYEAVRIAARRMRQETD